MGAEQRAAGERGAREILLHGLRRGVVQADGAALIALLAQPEGGLVAVLAKIFDARPPTCWSTFQRSTGSQPPFSSALCQASRKSATRRACPMSRNAMGLAAVRRLLPLGGLGLHGAAHLADFSGFRSSGVPASSR